MFSDGNCLHVYWPHICVSMRGEKRGGVKRDLFLFLTQFSTVVIILFVEVPYILRILTLLYIWKSFFFPLGNLNHRIETGEKIFYLHHYALIRGSNILELVPEISRDENKGTSHREKTKQNNRAKSKTQKLHNCHPCIVNLWFYSGKENS